MIVFLFQFGGSYNRHSWCLPPGAASRVALRLPVILAGIITCAYLFRQRVCDLGVRYVEHALRATASAAGWLSACVDARFHGPSRSLTLHCTRIHPKKGSRARRMSRNRIRQIRSRRDRHGRIHRSGHCPISASSPNPVSSTLERQDEVHMREIHGVRHERAQAGTRHQ